MSTINCRGRLVDLSQPLVMGILNLTPDSFFDGGQYNNQSDILKKCERMLAEGATILDIGGMSSRPGAEIIPAEEELKRVLPAIESILKEFPEAILSLDTVRGSVAQAGLESGIHIINDISAGSIDETLLDVVADYQVPYVLMHMQGKPADMQVNPNYTNVLEALFDFFSFKIAALRKKGIKDIIIDPGFGFGKTVNDNYGLLKNMGIFQQLEVPLLVGISRKSMICKVLRVNPDKALNGTTALHMVALQNGARILRVHDVLEAVETIKLWNQLEISE